MFLRCGFTKLFSEFKTVPFKEIKPLSNFSSPETHLRKVVFPEPLSPTNDKISPLLIESLGFLKQDYHFYDFLLSLTKNTSIGLNIFLQQTKLMSIFQLLKENIER